MTSGYRPEIIQRAFVGFIGSRLSPFWSLTTPKLRLIARRMLSEDLIALQFEVNRAFKQQAHNLLGGWDGGQHLHLSILLDGIYHQRSYSLVGLPQQALWWDEINNAHSDSYINKQKQPRSSVTIAVKPQGLISNYLTRQAALGTVFTSSVPTGDFTLAQATAISKPKLSTAADKPSALLFIAGGSGITPMLGLIMQALLANTKQQVTLLHYSRMTQDQSPLSRYWQQLRAKYPTFSYQLINTTDPDSYLANERHLSAQSLLALDLPLAQTQIFACGSPALLAGLYRAADAIVLPQLTPLRDNIIIERFGSALPELSMESQPHHLEQSNTIAPQIVHLRARQQQFSSSSTLLLSAEQAGMRLNYGCRQGICQLCRCNKVSGVVKNIQTGKLSSDGYESIQTCINIAITEVVLDI